MTRRGRIGPDLDIDFGLGTGLGPDTADLAPDPVDFDPALAKTPLATELGKLP